MLIGFLATSCSKPTSDTSSPTATVSNASPTAAPAATTNSPSFNMLLGQWQRPDGGYIIEVRDVKTDGKLEAYYFNPRPINVSKAQWRREADGLHVFVELQDQNYPGATYKLRYSSEQDQFAGVYNQPLNQQTFEVTFNRLRR